VLLFLSTVPSGSVSFRCVFQLLTLKTPSTSFETLSPIGLSLLSFEETEPLMASNVSVIRVRHFPPRAVQSDVFSLLVRSVNSRSSGTNFFYISADSPYGMANPLGVNVATRKCWASLHSFPRLYPFSRCCFPFFRRCLGIRSKLHLISDRSSMPAPDFFR